MHSKGPCRWYWINDKAGAGGQCVWAPLPQKATMRDQLQGKAAFLPILLSLRGLRRGGSQIDTPWGILLHPPLWLRVDGFTQRHLICEADWFCLRLIKWCYSSGLNSMRRRGPVACPCKKVETSFLILFNVLYLKSRHLTLYCRDWMLSKKVSNDVNVNLTPWTVGYQHRPLHGPISSHVCTREHKGRALPCVCQLHI